MFDEIQKIIFPNELSSFEYTKLQDLSKIYSKEQIVETYKNCGYKPLVYIEKVLKNKKKAPDWMNKEIINEELDNEAIETFNDFKNFIEEFRNEKD